MFASATCNVLTLRETKGRETEAGLCVKGRAKLFQQEFYLQKVDLSILLEKYNSTPEERSFTFKLIENQYNFYPIVFEIHI